MPKKKSSSLKETIVEPHQFSLVLSSGIKVYPISRNFKWYVQIDNNGKIKTYDKQVTQNELNDAIAKTIIHLYNQLTKDKNER
jgi:hypothetical protein